MKKVLILLFFAMVLVTSCTQQPIEKEKQPVKQDEKTVEQDETIAESNSPEYKLDKKLWSVNKGMMVILDEYADSHNGVYPDELSSISEAVSKLEEIDTNSILDRYTYTVSADNLKNPKGCYTLKMQFESEYYKKHHDEEGYFTLSSPKGSCK